MPSADNEMNYFTLKKSMKLSVVLPTRNRPELLKRTLLSIARQTVDQKCFEVIVIDNGPSIETFEIVNDFRGSICNLRFVEEHRSGLHNARHRGMKEARAELLVYADDDIEAFPGWLEGVLHGFNHYDAALVGGRNLPKWESTPPEWLGQLWLSKKEGERSLGFLSILDFGHQEKDIDPLYVWGCNFSVRKSVLQETGGFHPDSMPEEMLQFRGDGESYVSRFIATKGYKAVYIPSASVYHFVPQVRMTVDYFRRRAFAQGVSDSYTRLRQNPSSPDGSIGSSHPLGGLMAKKQFRGILEHFLPSGVFMRANIDQAYHEGFMWHTNRFINDAEVRNWVIRENYL